MNILQTDLTNFNIIFSRTVNEGGGIAASHAASTYSHVKIKLTNYVQCSQSYSLYPPNPDILFTEGGPTSAPSHPLKVLSNKFKESLSTC